MILSCLSFGFPEVPVGPASPPAVVVEEEAEDVKAQREAEEAAQAARDEAARQQAAGERAARSGGRVERERGRDADADEDGDWAKANTKESYDRFQLRALATAILPMRARGQETGGEFLVGVRGELDVRRLGFLFGWDRGGISPISLNEPLTETSYWNGLLGASVWATKYSRIRLLGGVSAVSSPRAVRFGPSVAATLRLGIPVVSIEGGVIYTPVGFQQLDARAELVVRLLIFEARGGYRARWVDTSRSADGPAVEPTGGLSVSLGLIF